MTTSTFYAYPRSDNFLNYYLARPHLIQNLELNLDTYSYIAPCHHTFTQALLQAQPYVRWPQSIVDGVHYLRFEASNSFYIYIRMRHAGWPKDKLAELNVADNEYWSESGDLINRYVWMWKERGSTLGLGDALYQLATIVQ